MLHKTVATCAFVVSLNLTTCGDSSADILSRAELDTTCRWAAQLKPIIPWPPQDPQDGDSPTNFTVDWAKRLRAFKTLSDLQRAAGARGRLSDVAGDPAHPHVAFHWVGTNNGVMRAYVYPDGAINVEIMTGESQRIATNNFGGFVCERCDPPIFDLGVTGTWSLEKTQKCSKR